MDCGSGLLLMLTRAIRQIEFGQLLLVHTEEPSVPPDLHDWARLAGHEIVTDTATAPKRSVAGHDPPGDGDRAGAITGGASRPVFTTGSPPGGQRLWLHSNFHCNLACDCCCAESSPRADPRLLPVEVAVTAAQEFAGLGGTDLIVTGGEPLLYPQLGPMLIALAGILPVTVLTVAMVFGRGAPAGRSGLAAPRSGDVAGEPGLRDPGAARPASRRAKSCDRTGRHCSSP